MESLSGVGPLGEPVSPLPVPLTRAFQRAEQEGLGGSSMMEAV